MNQDPDPIAPARPDVDSDAVPRPRLNRKPRSLLGLRKPELKLTSMIDVVFLLLVFFVVTANFQADEASLIARLPGDSGGFGPPPVPVLVELESSDDGMTCRMRVDGVPIDGATELASYMSQRVRTGQMASGDLVKITPQGVVRWQHVLNVYNACIDAELEQVTFAQTAIAR